MDKEKKILSITAFCLVNLFMLIPLFSQNNTEENLSAPAVARIKFEKAVELYKEGNYEKSRTLVDTYIPEFEEQKIFYPDYIKAKIYTLKAILSYVYMEDGYEQEIEELFIKAVRLYLDLEIGDVATVPLSLVDIFNLKKKEYLSQYTKTARRNSLGFVTTLRCTTTTEEREFTEGSDINTYTVVTEDFGTINIQPGIHYAFNITEFLSITADIKFPIQEPDDNKKKAFWNFWRIKTGAIWYPEFRVEQLVFGLGGYYILTIDDWVVTKNSLSFCGHGEVMFRMGFGIAADVEVLRFDLNLDLNATEKENISPIGLGDIFQLFFANIDLYILLTF